MKKALLLLLVLATVLTFPSCKHEPTPEEKKAAIKDEVLALMSEDTIDTRKSPDALFDVFEGNFAVSEITSVGNSSTRPHAVIHKDGVLYDAFSAPISSVAYQTTKSYSFVHKDVAMKISDTNGSAKLAGYSTPDDYKPSFLTWFGIDTSLLFGFASGESAEEEDAPELPALSADMLTVSDDFATCTFSEAYLKEFFIVLAETSSEELTDAEKETMLSEFEGSGVFNVTEKKLTFRFSAKSRVSGKFIIELSMQDHPTDGMSVYMNTSDTVLSSDTPVFAESSVAMKNIKYNGDDPISGTMEMEMKMTVESKYGNTTKTTVTTVNSSATVNVENKDAPLFSIIQKSNSTSRLNNGEPDVSEVTVDLSYEPSRTESPLRYKYEAKSNGSTASLQMNSSNVAFGSAVETIVIPEYVLDCAEERYESCKSSLDQAAATQ